MPTTHISRQRVIKNKVGAFVHHPVTSLIVVLAILTSVSLVVAHLLLDEVSEWQRPVEVVQIALTVFFFFELGTKYYVAPDKARFFAQYWIDIIAVLPWTQSLRVLRILRLLRVFRVALILSRRVRFVATLFRSAVGEYIVLGMIMLLLLAVGTFALYVSEGRARVQRERQLLAYCDERLQEIDAQLSGKPPPDFDPGAGMRAEHDAESLRERLGVIAQKLHAREPLPGSNERALLEELGQLEAKLPRRKRATFGDKSQANDLSEFENSFWAILYFLVATEPMINVPSTTVGRLIVLAVMFGGLTTFAIFTGVVTALMVNRLKRRMEIDDMDRFQLTGHMLICGWNNLVPLIIEEITQAPGKDTAIVVIADLEEPPARIANLAGGARVYFVRGDCTLPEALEQGRVRQAKIGIIVADTTKARSDQDRDARTVLAALMMERMSPGIYTCAELLNRENEQHLRAAGIEEVIVTSEVGGHHLAMAALYSGITEVLSELMTAKVGKTLAKVPVPEGYVGLTYTDALTRFKREKDNLVIGLEIKGQDGARSPGYHMLVNPSGEVKLGARDNLILIAVTQKKRGNDE